jgi:hypothetical protein
VLLVCGFVVSFLFWADGIRDSLAYVPGDISGLHLLKRKQPAKTAIWQENFFWMQHNEERGAAETVE